MACTSLQTKSKEDVTAKVNFDWLVGNWERINNSKGKLTYEKWEKIEIDEHNFEYKGLGFTLNGVDTIFKEELRIFAFDNGWIYEVIGVNPEPTNFVFSTYTDTSFVCNNELNDFPKEIAYHLHKDMLVAIVSGDKNKLEFEFQRDSN